MRRHVTLLTTVVLCAGVATCAKKPPAAGPPAGLPRPAPEFIAEAAPEPIATPGIWFAFDPDFIRNRYRSADLAFGSFTVSDEWRASAIHDENCSGEDAEVHVGAYEDHLGLDATEIPFSSPVQGERIAWGTVIEPPNVTTTQGNELAGC